jgi:hypothetical protein
MGRDQVSSAIALKKTPDGRILARRLDGQSLTDEDRQQARKLARQEPPPRAWVIDAIRSEAGNLRALKVCSCLVNDHLYVVFDPEFTPPAGALSYCEEELISMKKKAPEQVMKIHDVKVIFPGARVIQ